MAWSRLSRLGRLVVQKAVGAAVDVEEENAPHAHLAGFPRSLRTAYSLAKVGFDTEKNEPLKVLR